MRYAVRLHTIDERGFDEYLSGCRGGRSALCSARTFDELSKAVGAMFARGEKDAAVVLSRVDYRDLVHGDSVREWREDRVIITYRDAVRAIIAAALPAVVAPPHQSLMVEREYARIVTLWRTCDARNVGDPNGTQRR
jgi:hypothetical protein